MFYDVIISYILQAIYLSRSLWPHKTTVPYGKTDTKLVIIKLMPCKLFVVAYYNQMISNTVDTQKLEYLHNKVRPMTTWSVYISWSWKLCLKLLQWITATINWAIVLYIWCTQLKWSKVWIPWWHTFNTMLSSIAQLNEAICCCGYQIHTF